MFRSYIGGMKMKERKIAVCLLLSLITCGIYGIYWFVRVTDETNALAPQHKTASGVLSYVLSVVTFGGYALYWAYRTGQKAGDIRKSSDYGILYIFLMIFTLSVAPLCLAQGALNDSTSDKEKKPIE